MSVVCPHCNKRLILENSKISGYCGVREFATCGDVVVERNGHMAARVKVGNLTVKGNVQGNVIARGCVSIRKTGTLRGDIRAPRLHVESGAKIEPSLEDVFVSYVRRAGGAVVG